MSPAGLATAGACDATVGRQRRSAGAALGACKGGAMEHPGFFEKAAPVRLEALAGKLGARLGPGGDAELLIHDVKALAAANAGHLTFLDNRKYLPLLGATRASACLVAPAFAERVPRGTAALVMQAPYRGFARPLQLFYPEALFSKAAAASAGEPLVHPSAR